MADIAIPLQRMSVGGLEPEYYDSSSSPALTTADTFHTDVGAARQRERSFLYIKNGATEVNVTIVTPGTVGGLAIADPIVTVAANEERMIRLRPEYSGLVQVTFDDISNVEYAVIQV